MKLTKDQITRIEGALLFKYQGFRDMSCFRKELKKDYIPDEYRFACIDLVVVIFTNYKITNFVYVGHEYDRKPLDDESFMLEPIAKAYKIACENRSVQ